MHADVVAALRCPVCDGALAVDGEPRGPLRCPRRHSFDQARPGYVQLTARPLAHPGDSPAMVAARAAFLDAGHYAPIVEAVAIAAAAAYPGAGLLLDVGAGTGHYTVATLDRVPGAAGLALDVSKAAARVAARAHPRLDAVLADAWRRLPLADGTVGVLLDVFAPRNSAEFARVLRADGALVVVTPAADHLAELVAAAGMLTVDPDKEARLAASLGGFEPVGRRAVRFPMALSAAEADTLIAMTPSARHRPPDPEADPDSATGPEPTWAAPAVVTASVLVTTYVLRSTSSQPTGSS